MKLLREIHKCRPHGQGMLVRVRWTALTDDGAICKTVDGFPVQYEIEEVVPVPWGNDDTHESYVSKIVDKSGWQARATMALEKILLHNGLLKHRFEGVPALDAPKVF